MATDKDFKVKNGLQVDTDTLVVDATNDRVGINKASPTATLDIDGTTLLGTSSYSATTDTITDGSLVVPQGSRIVSKSSSGEYLRTIFSHESSNGHYIFGQTGTSLIGDMKFYAGSSGNFFFASGGSDTTGLQVGTSTTISYQPIRISSGGLQIGTTEVINSSRALTNITGITSTGAFKSSGGDSGTSGQLINAGGSAVNQTNSGTLRLTERTYDVSPYYQGAFVKYDGSANRLRIGTHAGTSQALSDDVSAIEIGRGSTTVDFQGAITATGNLTVDTNTFHVDTTNNRVGIGTTSPSTSLHINNGSPVIRLQDTDGTNQYTQISHISAATYFGARNDTADGTIIFGGYGGGSFTEYARFNSLGDLSTQGNITVGGNLTVNGTTTTIDTTNTNVKDSNITLNYSTGDSSATANNAGITIQDAVDASTDATILWDATLNRFNFSHEIKLPDNEKLLLGGGSDFQLYHNGSDSVIDNLTGDLYITNKADDKDILIQTDDGSGGVTTYMQFDGSASLTKFNVDTKHLDSVKATFGDSADLQMYHNGTDSFITNDTGIMYIRQNLDDGDILLQSDNGSGGVTTYIQLDGSAQLTNFAQDTKHNDSVKATFGASQDLQIYHDGSNSYIADNGTGDLFIEADNNIRFRARASGETLAIFTSNGAVDLRHNNSTKLLTTSTGVDVTGNVAITAGNKLQLAGSGDSTHHIYHNSTTDYDTINYSTGFKLEHYTSGTQLTMDGATGRVGIGTDAPASILEISGIGGNNKQLRLSTGATTYWDLGRSSSNGNFEITEDSGDTYFSIDKTSGAISISGALSISGGATRINMQEDHYVNRRFDLDSVDNNGTIYVLLCEDAANNDVNGTIKMDRTSGLRHACSVDILISSGNASTPVGTIRSMGTAGGGTPTYSLVKGTHTDTKTYIALKIVNPDNYYETSGAYFTGRIKTTVSSNEFLGVTTLTSISDFGANSKHQVANLAISGTTTASGTIAYSPDNGGDLTLSSDSTYGTVGSGEYVTLGFGGKSNGYNRIFGANTTDGNLFIASATGRGVIFRTNGGNANTFAMTSGGQFQVNDTTILDQSRNLSSIGTISSTGLVTIDANGTLNTLHIYDDSTVGQPGMVVTTTGNVSTSTQTLYAKQYGSGITASLFGQTLGGKAFVGTTGSASGGLLIGTSTADSVWIGTNSTAALTIDSSQNAAFAGDISLPDVKRIKLGTGNDLQLYHDSESVIEDAGTNGLIIKTDGPNISIDGGSDVMGKFIKDGAVELYYDNVKRLETTSSGVSMTNGLVVEGTTTFNDEVSFGSAITSNMNLANNAISAGDITSTGDVVSTSANYIYHRVDQIDSGSITMGVTSGSADGFLVASNTGTNHVATAPTLQFFLDTDGGSLVEEVRIDAGGLDIRNGGLDINGTEVITSARNLTNIGLISSTRLNSNNGGYTISYSETSGLYPNIRLQDTSGTNQYGEVSHTNGSTTIRSYNGYFTNGSITFAGASTYGSFDTSGDLNLNNDLSVTGALSKGSGSFKIDHPLKPDTHHLVHSFVEGPQADNIYRGVIKLEKGRATVDLDEWFGMTAGTFLALNRDIQAFVNNSETWDAVRAKVMGSQLVIECQNPESSAEVSWLVIGERQDKEIHESSLTNDNGKIIVEPEKVG